MPPSGSASSSSIHVPARSIKWCRPPRSGRQNIAESSRASAASSQTELRLVNVARASLEELLLDYEDFLRHRRLARRGPDDPDASAVRAVPRSFRKDQTDQADLTGLSDVQRYALYSH